MIVCKYALICRRTRKYPRTLYKVQRYTKGMNYEESLTSVKKMKHG